MSEEKLDNNNGSKREWGRKAKIAMVTFGAPFVVATAALFFGKMSADQWLSLVQFQAPLILGIYGCANVGASFMHALGKTALPLKK